MKPKKGETYVEMDEPMKNPLQLVKELVLLIVEARTPDLSVKGRAEGPHCPVIRGRPVHKCSAEKSECARATEYCSAAQRLWLNNIPICVDILLFPNCIHGQVEASVTEGAVGQISHENALLIERWTIDAMKRRQGECLPSSMLIQAVRSYLHFSQISSWLYSTGGNLPGLLTYRVYAPGEVTCMDFPQKPDIHNFPVCLANFNHIRVKVSSLQRQASVPILTCLQEPPAVQNQSTNPPAFGYDNLQKYQPRDLTVMAKYKPDCTNLTSIQNVHTSISRTSGTSKKAYSCNSKRPKGAKRYVKTLQEFPNEKDRCPDFPLAACASEVSVGGINYLTENMYDVYDGPVTRQTLYETGLLARKKTNLIRFKTNDSENLFGGSVCTTSVNEDKDFTFDDEFVDRSLHIDRNLHSAAQRCSSSTLGKAGKFSNWKERPSDALVEETNYDVAYTDNFLHKIKKMQDYRSTNLKKEVKAIDNVEDNILCTDNTRTHLTTESQSIKYTVEEDNREKKSEKKKKAEYSKVKKSLFESQSDSQIGSKMWWPLQQMQELEKPAFVSKVTSSNKKKLKFPLSAKDKFSEGSFNETSQFNIATSKIRSGIDNVFEEDASEEELIRKLSDRMSLVNLSTEMFLSSKFQDNNISTQNLDDCQHLIQTKIKPNTRKRKPHNIVANSSTNSFTSDSQNTATKCSNIFFIEKSNRPELSISISRSLEDSDNTPLASPNQKIQLTPLSRSLIKSVADESVKENWLQQNLVKPTSVSNNTHLGLANSADCTSSMPQEFRKFVEHDTNKRFDEVTLNRTQSDLKQPISMIIDSQDITKLDVKGEVNKSEENRSDQNTCSPQLKDVNSSCLTTETSLYSNGHINESPLSEDHSSSCQDDSKHSSRRMFEESPLPLVSYDADSDSFRKVEELYNSNILHSPKVLFSCAVPSTKTTSQKCIDFGDIFETEFFQAKISDMVNSEAIGKYMSNLAILSSSFTNNQEDQESETSVPIISQGDVTDSVYNFIEFPSKTDSLLNSWKDILQNSDSCSIHDYSLTETENNFGKIIKHQSKRAISKDTFTSKKDSEKDSQTNLLCSHSFETKMHTFEDTGSTVGSKACEDKTLASIPVGDCSTQEINTPENENQKAIHFRTIVSKEMLFSFSSKKGIISSPLTSLLFSVSPSSSISSSSSSTSSVRKLSDVPFQVSSQKSVVSKQETFQSDNDNNECICSVENQITMSKDSFNVISTARQDKVSTAPCVDRNLHPQEQPFCVSSDNNESLDCSDLHLCDQSALQSLIASSMQPASLSTLSLQPTELQLQQNSQESECATLCQNDNKTTRLSTIITRPMFNGNTDLNNKLLLTSKPRTDLLIDFQYCNCDLLPNQKIVQSISDSHSDCNHSHCVHELFQDKLLDEGPIPNELISQDREDELSVNNGNISASSRLIEETEPTVMMLIDSQSSHSRTKEPETKLPPITFLVSSAYETSHFVSVSNEIQLNQKSVATSNRPVKHHQIVRDSSLTFDSSIGVSLTQSAIDATCCDFVESNITLDILDNCFDCETDDGSLLSCEGITDSASKITFSSTNNISSQVVNPPMKTNCSNHVLEKPYLLVEIQESPRDLTSCKIHEEQPRFVDLTTSAQCISSCIADPDSVVLKEKSDVHNIEMCYQQPMCSNEQNKSMQLDPLSRLVTRTCLCSKTGCEDHCFCAHNKTDKDTDRNKDVVFYLSECESKVKPKSHKSSVLSMSLIENTSSEISRATRPSSLSAEVSLEPRLGLNSGMTNNSNYDFCNHSPPFHGSPPGWSSVPPHRTVSTPSCMDRETARKDENSIPSISVIQQQNCDIMNQSGLRRMAAKSASMIFNNRTGLPTQSSPAPLKRKSGGKFDYDVSLLNTRAIKSAFSCSKLASNEDGDNDEAKRRTLSTSAPASTNCLLGNFEESILNGRIDPVGTVDGFTAEIGASGSFCPKHLHLPVSAFFFALSDDNAPSPYLGHINLESVGKKGYHIPKKGTVQVTLFNPNKTVVKMFVVVYDLSDMPASSQTFIRQRTVYCPTDKDHTAPSYLRYLIHLRCASSQSGNVYLHTDIRLIFARHKLDIDAKTIPYELKSYTEGPQNPKYSPKK